MIFSRTESYTIQKEMQKHGSRGDSWRRTSVVHPKISFGRPALIDSGIPTATLADAARVEGAVATVAELFEISVRRVNEAIRFENSIRLAA